MFPARDVRGAVGPLAVTDWQVDDLAVELGSAEDQIIITEWVEVAEVGAVGSDPLIILFPENLCAAERILDRLPKQPGERHTEKFVAQEVERLHGFLFHGIDQADPVDEL